MKHYQSYTPPRPAEYNNGQSTEYRGFTISDRFVVTFNGKVIWDDCLSLAQCKSIIDQSLAMNKLQRMPDKQAALRSLWGACELENNAERVEYETNQVNDYYEQQLEP